MGAQIFFIAVSVIIAGWLWFYVVRPILEDYGIISVNFSEEPPAAVMSREQENAPVRAPSAVQTDEPKASDRPMMAVPTRDEMLDIFRVLRKYGIKREELRGAWNAAGLKLDNNLWSQAEPPPVEEANVTPIAGRPTNARFHEDDPALEYQPLR